MRVFSLLPKPLQKVFKGAAHFACNLPTPGAKKNPFSSSVQIAPLTTFCLRVDIYLSTDSWRTIASR